MRVSLQSSPRIAGIAALVALVACGGASEPTDRLSGARDDVAMSSETDVVAARSVMGGATAEAIVSAKSAPGASASPLGFAQRLPGGTTAVTPAMVIRTGQASVEVESVERAAAQLRTLALRLGGYVGTASLQAGREQTRSAMLELKVPAERFDDAVGGLTPLGRVEVVSADAQDVGEEFTDLEARATNGHRMEERLVQLLATRTGKLDDVLTVERELARVREEIERIEGRMRYLRTRATMSTLTVTVHEPLPLAGTGPGDNPIGRATRQAWENFIGMIAATIAASGVLIPLGLLVALVWMLLRRYVPPRRREAET